MSKHLGLEWDSTLYKKLLLGLKKYQADSTAKISDVLKYKLKEISQEIYPVYGKEKQYRENVEYFINSYLEKIILDCSLIEQHDVIAPRLEEWNCYKNSLIDVMTSTDIFPYFQKWMESEKFKFSMKIKEDVLIKVYNLPSEEPKVLCMGSKKSKKKVYDQWMLKKLENMLNNNRDEIITAAKEHITSNNIDLNEKIECENLLNSSDVQNTTINQRCLTQSTHQFAFADDIANSLVIDIFYLNKKTHKINQNILGELATDKNFKEEIKMAINDFRTPISDITNNLLVIIKRHFKNINIPKKMLERQLKSYLLIVKPDSGFAVQICNRYSKNINQGVTICATKFWPKNAILKYLNGYTTKLTKEELEYLINANLDFSIMSGTSTSENQRMWLGPGSYVNHDCEPNAKLYTLKMNGELCLQATKNIHVGDEITWNYGLEYFGTGECECMTCKKENKDAKAPALQIKTPATLKNAVVVLDRLSRQQMNKSNNSMDRTSNASSEVVNSSFSDLSMNTINEILGIN
ncbi:histone-lysine N-methyltransferase KMT5B [Nasonia vitripennis]|uniref:SET domain-containing protein n=1 Tax=Nasonia vitripennis TaxID=7425 RepID=A0A7M7M2G3_NASVI|nr:histone-lysine N-methyltransferase KMT5B [Nasonia vitripennis]